MSQKTEIVNKTVGYSFHVKIEREIRTETGAKYPDKSVITASFRGNDEVFGTMIEHAKQAKKTIDELLSDKTTKEQQGETS